MGLHFKVSNATPYALSDTVICALAVTEVAVGPDDTLVSALIVNKLPGLERTSGENIDTDGSRCAGAVVIGDRFEGVFASMITTLPSGFCCSQELRYPCRRCLLIARRLPPAKRGTSGPTSSRPNSELKTGRAVIDLAVLGIGVESQ